MSRGSDDCSLRVAIFSDSAPPLVNGVATSVSILAASLAERGHAVRIFGPGLRAFASSRSPLNVSPASSGVGNQEPAAFDIVHAHTPFGAGLAGARLAKQLGIPLVASFHTAYGRVGASYAGLRSAGARLCLAKYAKWFYGQADRVIVPSHAAECWLREIGVHSRSTRIPTAVMTHPLGCRIAARNALSYDPTDTVFLCVSRLADEKNIHWLIQAMNLCRLGSARLLVAGDGPLRRKLARMAAASTRPGAIRFVGQLRGAVLRDTYAAADAVVLASECETQGLAVIEASAARKPSIVCVGSGTSEFVVHGETGMVVDPTPEAFADAIDMMGASKEREKMGDAAFRLVQTWSPADMAAVMSETYRTAIQAHSTLGSTPHEREFQIR